MTNTTQPAASLSGSELDRLREMLDQFKKVERFPSYRLMESDVREIIVRLEDALAERQQDRQRIADLEEGLRFIKDKQGKVCSKYEICAHQACESSYSSWATADSLLSPEAQPNWYANWHEPGCILDDRAHDVPCVVEAQPSSGGDES